ncbi:MAG: hypothetical protein IKF52_00745 [Clostridia bacterium]|nr:hypothetical protein [Clostridia bacterium]
MKELKIKINNEGINFLKDVVETGKNSQLQSYYQLTRYEKESLLGSMFSERLRKLIVKYVENNDQITVSEGKDGEIIIQKKVLVNLLGEKKGGRVAANGVKNATISINAYPTAIRIALSAFTLKDYKLVCNLNVEEVNLSKKSIIKAIPTHTIKFFKSPDKIDYDIYFKDLNYLKNIQKDEIPNLFIEKFEECFEQMNMPISNSKLLEMFFNKLYEEGFTFVYGDDAVKLSRIFGNINKYYPLFNSLSMDQKLSILTEGYQKARAWYRSGSSTDPFIIARCIFDILIEKNLVNIVRISSVDYRLIEKYSGDIIRDGKIFKKNFLIWLRFEYNINNQTHLTTAFHASELWGLLCKTNFFEGF